MQTIDEALKLVPNSIAPKLEFDGGITGGVARCYLFPVNGIGIGAQPTKWLAFADATMMPEAIAKAVKNLTAKTPVAPNPVRCGSCGWTGDATDLLDEGHCPKGCHASGVTSADTWADKIARWIDSEGDEYGKELADAGMIQSRPATDAEVKFRDLEPGDHIWDLTDAGNAEFAARRATAS